MIRSFNLPELLLGKQSELTQGGAGRLLPAYPDFDPLSGINTIDKLNLKKGAKVFVRLGQIERNTKNFKELPRIQAIYRTLKLLIACDVRVVATTHISGHDEVRPKETSKTAALVHALGEAFPDLKEHLGFIPFSEKECLSGNPDTYEYLSKVRDRNNRARPGFVHFTENPRLFGFEQSNSRDKRIATLIRRQFRNGAVINASFDACHRKHFTTYGLFTLFPPERKALCPSSFEEWKNLSLFAHGAKERSIALFLGGEADKFDSKLVILEQLLDSNKKIGAIAIGTIFAAAFLFAKGQTLGKTPLKISLDQARKFLDVLNKLDPEVKIILPETFVGTSYDKINSPDKIKAFNPETDAFRWPVLGRGTKSKVKIPENAVILDQEPTNISAVLGNDFTHIMILGPQGKYSIPYFATGTRGTLSEIQGWLATKPERRALFGGGNTLEAVNDLIEENPMPGQLMVSAGGGAAMDALSRIFKMQMEGVFSHPVLDAMKFQPAV